MLNGNGGSELVPQPIPGMPIQGVQDEGQVGVRVEEPSEAVILGVAEFQGPRIFVNVPRYEWRPEVHVQHLDEEARAANCGDGGTSPPFWCQNRSSRVGTTPAVGRITGSLC